MPAQGKPINQTQAARQLRKDLFISLLALISVAIGVYDLVNKRTSTQFTWYDIMDLCIVAIFIIDFVWSAVGSGNWRKYARKHWYEIPSLIPITGNMVEGAQAVPLLRSLRLVRLVRVVRLLRLIGAATRLRTFFQSAIRIARRAHVDTLILIATIVIFTGACVAWLVEGNENTHFASFGEALWWAINMFSNVAYVEFHPSTIGGRVVAGFLEFTGIAFIGLFTASLAGALLKDKPQDQEDDEPLD